MEYKLKIIKKIRLIAIVIVFMLGAFALSMNVGCSREEQTESEVAKTVPEYGNVLTGEKKQVAQNDDFELYVNPDNGEFEIASKNTGEIFTSNPVGREDDEIARDIWRTNLASQMIVDYSNIGGTIYSQVNSFVGSFRKEGLRVYENENGFITVYEFPDEQFAIPLEISLTEYGLRARIILEDVYGDGKRNFITAISLLPFMGAASQEDTGYMFVPDGSGALIYHNNDKFSAGSFMGEIHGPDASYKPVQSFANRKNAYLPVFGTKIEERALFSIITEGESLGRINSHVSGGRTSFNFVYPSFTMRARDSFFITDRSGRDRENFVLDRRPIQLENIDVRYYFLEGETADYMGMVNTYRDYLMNEAGVEERDNQTGALYLDLYAAVRKTVPRLGIPVTSEIPLTTYSQAADIVNHFREYGVDEFVLRLRSAQSQDVSKKPARRFTLNSTLGRRNEFESLAEEVGDGRLYLAMDPINIKSDIWFVRTLRNTTKTVMGLPAHQLNYDLASGFRDQSDRWYLLSPEVAVDYFESYISGALRSEYTSYIAVEEIGNKLYSNYGDNWFDVEKTKSYWVEALGNADNEGAKLMMEGANSYVLAFADRVSGIPAATSSYGLIDEEIPFVQLVLNGIIEYGSEHINLSSNPQRSFLKAIESDSCLSYSFIAEDPVVLRDTELSRLYGSLYEGWSEVVAYQYKRYYEMKEKTMFSRITDHEILGSGVVRVTYENGYGVIINYNSDSVTVDGISIGPMDFKVYERTE